MGTGGGGRQERRRLDTRIGVPRRRYFLFADLA